ncbi:MAG: LPS assembly protein LptD [Parvularcula sp.]|jgi:LPS-assembly protein|nr:LPS assembly protein LptD [Parvularcula sp.]
MTVLPLLTVAASSLLTVQGERLPETPVEAEGGSEVVLSADRIYRQEGSGPLVAEGNVRASSGTQFLRADQVRYDQAADRVTAIGNVAVRDESGQVYFAEEVILSSDLKNGIAASFASELAPQGNLAAATVIRRESGENELRKATFSLCPVCDEGLRADRPVWQVKANRIIQDEEDQVLRFRNAFVEVLGVPVMWIPWLQVPDPAVERQSGFLAPQLGNSTRTGTEVEVPYYWAISDYQDVTFSPRYMTELGLLTKGEWRRNTHNSRAVVQTGFISPINDLTEEPGNPDDFRWHLFGLYERQFQDNWKLDLDIDQVSDKGYLFTYDIEPVGALRETFDILRPDRLDSSAAVTQRTEGSETQFAIHAFQTLRFGENQEFTAHALPRIRHERSFDWMGGTLDLGGSYLLLNRAQGLDTMRLSSHAQYSSVHFTRNGHRFETFGELRADGYAYNNAVGGVQACNVEDANYEACRELLPGELRDDRFTRTRILPTIGAEWSYPLAKFGGGATFIIEPKVQAVISPDRNDNDDIFNEDSTFFQFDEVTLFDFSKGTGLDRWEDGRRLNMGLSGTAVLGQGLTINGMIGAQVRADETEIFEQDTGIGGETSDIVGYIDMQIGRNIVFDNRFRIDENSGAFRRLESRLSGRVGPVSGGVNYLRVESDELAQREILDEFLTLNAALRVNRNVSFAFFQAQNLDSGNTTNTNVALRLNNDCAALSLNYRFTDSTADGFEQNQQFFFRVEVLGLR